MDVTAWSADGPMDRVTSPVPGLVHLRSRDGVELFLEGVPVADARSLPSRFSSVRVANDPVAPGVLALLDGERRLHARAWRLHRALPALYAAPLARFAPTPKEERTIRWLLRLLRVPGVTRLIRLWHAWRTR